MTENCSESNVKRVISRLLINGGPSIDKTVKHLGVSPRTLQRRLMTMGVTYTQLVDVVRYEQACKMITLDGLKLMEVAKKLGYSDASSFTRAFERWAGISPREYRGLNSGITAPGKIKYKLQT